MEKTVLVELTSKQIKLAEGIVLMCLFGSIAAGLGLMYLWLPLGIAMFCTLQGFHSSRSVLSVSGGGG